MMRWRVFSVRITMGKQNTSSWRISRATPIIPMSRDLQLSKLSKSVFRFFRHLPNAVSRSPVTTGQASGLNSEMVLKILSALILLLAAPGAVTAQSGRKPQRPPGQQGQQGQQGQPEQQPGEKPILKLETREVVITL